MYLKRVHLLHFFDEHKLLYTCTHLGFNLLKVVHWIIFSLQFVL